MPKDIKAGDVHIGVDSTITTNTPITDQGLPLDQWAERVRACLSEKPQLFIARENGTVTPVLFDGKQGRIVENANGRSVCPSQAQAALEETGSNFKSISASTELLPTTELQSSGQVPFFSGGELGFSVVPGSRKANSINADDKNSLLETDKLALTIQQFRKAHDWVYRVLDQLIRANGLDEYAWRMKVVPEYSINASVLATEANQITVYFGLIDQLYGDDAALAAVLGHELTHLTKRHAAVAFSNNAELIQQLNAEADQEIQAEIKKSEDEARRYRNKVKAAAIACAIVPICGRIPLPQILLGLYNTDGYPDPNKVEQRKKEIIAQKQQHLDRSGIELGRKQETEADENGCRYMMTAGFDPQGCLRVMQVLARIPIPEPEKDVHPPATFRLENLRRFIANTSSQALAAQGAARLRQNPTPLTAEWLDEISIRINSKFVRPSKPNKAK